MVIDSSAIVAVIIEEPGYQRLVDRIQSADSVGVGAATALEATLVLSSLMGRDARPVIRQFFRDAEVQIIPFTDEHFDIAVDAFLRYGKGRHRAALNFGDCLSYATAMLAGVPLLFTGDDFRATDVEPA